VWWSSALLQKHLLGGATCQAGAVLQHGLVISISCSVGCTFAIFALYATIELPSLGAYHFTTSGDSLLILYLLLNRHVDFFCWLYIKLIYMQLCECYVASQLHGKHISWTVLIDA